MIRIHKSIFYDICEKNIDLYNDFMKDLLNDYKETLREIQVKNGIKTIRFYTHRMFGIICYLSNSAEVFYICKMILAVDKQETDVAKYEYWIKELHSINYLREFFS